ncbi:proline-rich receptor-like protein kinase PERK15 [Amaranthus tricolor]|uniref:proline-rich receptor-like protein kinase PERK15 n=1 Tax=Amaranthus tricolor TaxID=29722 RepID=UPI00258ABF95|nr:proline-rich receptor-like protein kinase PERK15 [Amaranthus tricolor]
MDSPPPEITPLIPADNVTIASPPVASTGLAALPPSNSSTIPLTPPSSSGMSKQTLTALIVGIGLGGLIVLIAVGIFVFFYKRRKRKLAEDGLLLPTKHNPFGGQTPHSVPLNSNDAIHQQHKSDPPPPQCAVVPIPPSTSSNSGSELLTQPFGMSSSSLPFPNGTFTYEELALATDNFSSANLLGQGGFGYVHKGILPNGKEIAVKQLKTGSVQGEREFQAEVDTISRVHHRHLVSLVGHCMCGEQRMLVYEFIPNKTLEFHLHGEGKPPMSWETRLKIAVGAAKGLAYLHEDCHPKIIHRDIKASNILIDDEFEAKVADFGLAKFSFDTDTHVSTRVMGTFGYLAPEYASSGKLTEKSDVFSFGVVLLELITGRRPVDKARPFMDDSMVEWARPLLSQALEGRSFNELVDPRLEEYNSFEMAQMIACAAVCVRSSARRRPQMSQVVRALEGNLSAEDLLKEIAPDNRTFHGSSDYDSSAQYKEDLKKFRKLALDSQEQSTGEYSVFTNEHGMPPSTSSTENQPDTQEIETGKSKTGTRDAREIPVE